MASFCKPGHNDDHDGEDIKVLPKSSVEKPHPLGEEWRLARALLRITALDYYWREALRPGIESWLQGDDAPISFADVCATLGFESTKVVATYIRNWRPSHLD